MTILPPTSKGTVHIIGIGGAGMNGLARILLNRGYKVTGSDLNNDSEILTSLQQAGVKIFKGRHHSSQVPNSTSVVAHSSAIAKENPEIIAALQNNLPVLSRAELLASIMGDEKYASHNICITGTHGKSTTTALLGSIFACAGRDPLVLGGAVSKKWGGTVRIGSGEDFIVEADESDGTMCVLPTHVAAITNANPEHLDHYGSEQAMYEAYIKFMNNAKSVLVTPQAMHPILEEARKKVTKMVLTFGLTPRGHLYASRICTTAEGMRFILHLPNGEELLVQSHLHGKHNVLNCMLAAGVAHVSGVAPADIRVGIQSFSGVARRFSVVGHANNIKVIDDYAHHPNEIRATLRAAQALMSVDKVEGRLIAIFQPHRYSRLKNLYNDFLSAFEDADLVLVTDVYSAGEAVEQEFDLNNFAQQIQHQSQCQVIAVPQLGHVPKKLSELVQDGDWVLCMGAGDITRMAQVLPQVLLKNAA